MIARMLNYYPQLDLDRLEALPVDRFLLLFMGMLDNLFPGVTEPRQEMIDRKLREAHDRARSRSRR